MTHRLGYYVTCDDAECNACHDPDSWPGFEGWDEPLPIFTNTEADAPTHCCICDALIPHALTDDGRAYVIETLSSPGGRPEIREQWIVEYDLPNPFADRGNVPDLFGGVALIAVMDDGGALCERCLTDPTNPVHDARHHDYWRDGWSVVGFMHTGETDEPTSCDHCGRVLA